MSDDDTMTEKEVEQKERDTLQRLLSTPPKPRAQKKGTAKPKKPDRPSKAKERSD
ncbi:hypothetical protein [Oricola indica]|uniref:hypothetical protein n=1 Tax=Oricola indica TaxID=2872591 RepID=UPI003CCBFA04